MLLRLIHFFTLVVAATSFITSPSLPPPSPLPRAFSRCLPVLSGLASPALKQKTVIKKAAASPGQPAQKAKVAQPQTRGSHETEDAPRYKVILIGDEEYDEEHVIERMVDVVDDVDKKASIEIFHSAQQGGKGLVGVYPLEQSEHYVEQFLRSEPMIFTELEKE
ncbi:hypothetical protein TrVE_jg374 [Triparma verrucosa]|uniref:Adaptor protein ClpS core domain-containing protein n=2 Tax=Triparma TaxID=722752 RepID=A0A9W7BJ88_9STRA|nr:hypothetical protein TrVE_jg374 [Triparma verrucosa]GMH89521.1 hypothetical protein TrST_g11349 [Triparma strigata]